MTGNPYPVVEHRNEENSFLGLPLKGGYQSNYVLVSKDGNPHKTGKDEPGDNVYDEIVIDQESHVRLLFLSLLLILLGRSHLPH